MKPWTLDFETTAIDGYIPPEPVGLAVRSPIDQQSVYLSWGHPGSPRPEQDLASAKELLFKLFRDREPVLFHNAKFDLGVAAYHWQLAPKDYTVVHDTMFLLFLNNPYSANLSLKPSAEEILAWPPDEKDELERWILAHVPEATPKTTGAYICKAPHDVVAPYAIGDVDRTYALFEHLYESVCERDMKDAYLREQRLLPILYQSEQRGVRIARDKLEEDLEKVFEPALVRVEDDLRKRLDTPDLDFGKKDQIADALDRSGFVTEWVLTPTGRRSTSKENLEFAINNPTILHLLRYRGAMAGVLQTFGRPWLEDSLLDGRLHPSWNQVRTRGSHDQGTRTGRLSCSRPNLMNIPNELKIIMPEGYPTLPFMRQYMLPEEKCVWLKRDYASQEVRILAHFEDGELMHAYQADPNLDPHGQAMDKIKQITGIDFPRKDVKITAFSIIYGAGVPSLAGQLGRPVDEAANVKNGYLTAFPGVGRLQRAVTKIGDSGGYIRTWGGRMYFAEPSLTKNGKVRRFSYKLLNYLIQGSAADQTKDSIIDWEDHRGNAGETFLCAVHDENNISAPEDEWEAHMATLRESMDRDILDVPTRSEGFIGPNWFDLKPCA